jgi:hypothetical protein
LSRLRLSGELAPGDTAVVDVAAGTLQVTARRGEGQRTTSEDGVYPSEQSDAAGAPAGAA